MIHYTFFPLYHTATYVRLTRIYFPKLLSLHTELTTQTH